MFTRLRSDANRRITRPGIVSLTFGLAAAGYVMLSLIGIRDVGPPEEPRLLTVIVAGVGFLGFVSFVLPGAILALQGWGRLSIIPIAPYFAVIVIILLVGGGLPSEWALLRTASLLLVLLPTVVLAAHLRGRFPRKFNRMDASSLAFCFGIAASILFAWGVIVDSSPSVLSDLSRPVEIFAACFMFGVLAGTLRPGWPWAPLLVPTLWVGWVFASLLLLYELSGQPGPQAADLLVLPVAPSVLVTFAGSMEQPLRNHFDRSSQNYPLFLLVAVNALNGADAILTEFAVRAGQASEFNPVASVIGSIGKVALVGAASYFLYRIRPPSLLWPILALALVLAYHATGALFDL